MGNGVNKEDRIIEEIATKETYLECPVLVDLDHGTIRHRHEEKLRDENNVEKPTKVGYFYHPKLNDFSEDAIMSCGDNNRLKYVFEGPTKDLGKKLYYIYGTNPEDKDKGIRHSEYKPQGKGYNWPQSYRKANNLYYDVVFIDHATIDDNDDDNVSKIVNKFGSDTESQSSGIILDKNPQQKDNITLKVRSTETVGNVIECVSLQLLLPSTNIHLMWNKSELSKTDLIIDLKVEETTDESPYCTICLKLT